MRTRALMVRTGSALLMGLVIVGLVASNTSMVIQPFDLDEGDTTVGALSIVRAVERPGPSDIRSLSDGLEPYFIENLGQMGEGGGLFYASGEELSIAIGEGWMSYLVHPKGSEETSLVKVTFVGSNHCRPQGFDMMDHRSSYFLGGSPDEWFTCAPSYSEVMYDQLWDGIDMRLFFKGGKLKYEFHVHPGTDPYSIVLRYDGVDDLRIDPNSGDLVIDTGSDALRDSRPSTFQAFDGVAKEVPSRFAVEDGNRVTFELGEFDRGRPLVIDPGIAFSTYLGGDGVDDSSELMIDEEGDIYLLGSTYSSNFPVTAGAYKRNETDRGGLFILRMDANLSRIEFSAFIGCEGPLVARGLHVDPQGYIYIICHPEDPSFPVTSGSYDTTINGKVDGVILKMEPNATGLVYSTFIGGSMWDFPFDIAVDDLGNAIVAGVTYSSDFPTTDDAFDDHFSGSNCGFLLKLSSDGSDLLYSTFIDGGGAEEVENLWLLPSGEVYLLGATTSGNFPTTANAFDRTFNGWIDAFFMVFNITGSRVVHSTFIGGTGLDSGNDLFVDGEGNIHIVGVTYSRNFPTTIDAYDRQLNGDTDGYALKIRSTDWRLDYSTYLGGSYDDVIFGVCVDDQGRALVVGYSDSSNFPTTDSAHSSVIDGSQDAVLTALSKDGADLSYSTFLGGSDAESLVAIRLDPRECPVMIGWTRSNDFPTTSGAYDTSPDHLSDCVIMKMDLVIPSITSSTIPSALTTGDPFRLAINATDNLGVEEVTLEHWYGNDSIHSNATFSRAPGGGVVSEWYTDLLAPSDRVEDLNYILKVRDASGNVNDSFNGTIPVFDNDVPCVWMNDPPPEGYGTKIDLVGMVTDNIDVQTVRLYYRFGARDHEEVQMDQFGTTSGYIARIQAPAGFVGHFEYYMMASDGADNINSTMMFISSIYDDQLAELLVDLSDTNATTGDTFTFKVEVGDNIGISSVFVNLWYGSDDHPSFPDVPINLSLEPLDVMELGNGTYICTEHVIPGDSLEPINYLLDVMDRSGNWNRTDVVSISVVDDDPPEVVGLLSSLPITTGDPYEVVVRITDNIGIAYAFVHHNIPGADVSWVRMSGIDIESITNGTYGTILGIPNDWSGPLNLTFEVADTEGNILETEVFVLEVADDEAPTIDSWEFGPGEVLIKGLEAWFKVLADDNIQAPQVHLVYWFGDGERTNASMDLDVVVATPYVYTLTVAMPREAEGDFSFMVIARDDQGNWNSTMLPHLLGVLNPPPAVEPLPMWSVTEEEETPLDLSPYIRDENDPNDALRIIVDHEGLSSDGLVLIAYFEQWTSMVTVPITVTDGEASTMVNIVLTVTNVNDAPHISNITPEMGSIFREGETIVLHGNASDEDGDELTYTWMDDNVLLGMGEYLSLDDLSPGDHTITLHVTDGIDTTAMTTVVEVEGEPASGAPLWVVVVVVIVIIAVVSVVLYLMRVLQRGEMNPDEDPYGKDDDGRSGG